jgi:hypothetical protein
MAAQRDGCGEETQQGKARVDSKIQIKSTSSELQIYKRNNEHRAFSKLSGKGENPH